MNNPLVLLLFGISVIIILVLVFYPSIGLYARLTKRKPNQKKVLIEDALKFLYNCEYDSVSCSLESIAGNLNITTDKTTELITTLERMELVIYNQSRIELTQEGKSYALKVIRVHRLWEKYLADETSFKEIDWHKNAEEIEHILSSTEVEILAANIGNPVFDPHGDPIPAENGQLPERSGIKIIELEKGDFANIIHIEDEPPAVYSQIVEKGLYPGMQIQLVDKFNDRICFLAHGEEVFLSPMIANSITVNNVNDETTVKGKIKTLSMLESGEKAKILGIEKSMRGQQRRRLMDFGIVPGTDVTVELRSLSGNPTAYKIRGAVIALRKEHSDKILLVPEEEKS